MPDIQGAAIRPKYAAAYFGIGITKLWQLARTDPTFPKPFKIGNRCTLWYRAELDSWIARQAAKTCCAA